MSAADQTATTTDWVDTLVESGVLVPTGSAGLWGQGEVFARVVRGVEDLLASVLRTPNVEIRRFPPVQTVTTLDRSGYLRSFPHLAGLVSTFSGDERAHRDLLAALENGAGYDGAFELSPMGLCSSACHPLYPTLTGRLPEGGRCFDVHGEVFRNEPSADPARMMVFHQYELVYVGEPEGADRHVEEQLALALDVLGGLELSVSALPANDPFFGRAGRVLASGQLDSGAKAEVCGPTGPSSPATALASVNRHRDHFATAFAIVTAEGAPAHSACIGFGVERIALALLWRHGLDCDGWPTAVQAQLWPDGTP
jgi:hypothetical protein